MKTFKQDGDSECSTKREQQFNIDECKCQALKTITIFYKVDGAEKYLSVYIN